MHPMSCSTFETYFSVLDGLIPIAEQVGCRERNACMITIRCMRCTCSTRHEYLFRINHAITVTSFAHKREQVDVSTLANALIRRLNDRRTSHVCHSISSNCVTGNFLHPRDHISAHCGLLQIRRKIATNLVARTTLI